MTASSALLFVGVAILAGGTLALSYLWFREREAAPKMMLGEYLAEPPGDLPAALVAYLLEGRVTARGLLAALLELGPRGLALASLRDGDLRLVRSQGPIPRKGRRHTGLREYERTLFYAALGSLKKGEAIPVSALGKRFAQQLTRLYGQLGEEGSAYFVGRLLRVRRRYLLAAEWGLALALAGAALALLYLRRFGAPSFAPSLGLAALALELVLAGYLIPRATPNPAQELARWRAFRRHLARLGRDGDLSSAQKAVEAYIHYAIALEVEKEFLAGSAELGAQLPSWIMLPARNIAEGGGQALLREPAPDTHRPIAQVLAQSLEKAQLGLARLLEAPLADSSAQPSPRLILRLGSTTLVLVGRPDLTLQEALEEILFASRQGGWEGPRGGGVG